MSGEVVEFVDHDALRYALAYLKAERVSYGAIASGKVRLPLPVAESVIAGLVAYFELLDEGP